MKRNLMYLFLMILEAGYSQIAPAVNVGTFYVSENTNVSIIGDFNNTETATYENNGEVLFKGNFTNDGITGFNASLNGYTRFEGVLNQDIKGKIMADFKNVLFNNTNTQPAFRLYNGISIAGRADFSRGIVDNDAFGGLFVFGNLGNHINASDQSFVDGPVIKDGSTDFVFPVGDKEHYRFEAMSAPGNNSSSFIGKYFFENSNPLYPHTNKASNIVLIDNAEYWTFEKGAGDDVLLTLSWDENSTTPEPVVASPYEDIHIVRWDSQRNLWIDEGGVADSGRKTVTTAVNLTNYGVFTLGRVENSSDCVEVYNLVTPDDDGFNDTFQIKCINSFPENTVEIYNRWGVKVFETNNYNSSGNVFKGYSQGRTTVAPNKMLPAGTYFYILEYENNQTSGVKKVKKAGYLYLQTKE
ncbi:gliding motility-associated C-terminal domain-containing protein [Flavobacterium sp. DG2-3]|uniref:gliding motility-associated C-terminal domain-containing protein n=1 Tax=Flavobacterium sp. DG2-3 TaxID=3068317 RepID=UPI00273F545B|nr:gliding motility-associated C-terminal domain-containing protein [Flavobacterium sp. DG2-3]MDP5202348.1 gliding motility-associated C-terminal domain-containing protein [Flavobacterium sp. DG2-3]